MLLKSLKKVHNTSPEVTKTYDVAIARLDTWLSDGLLNMTLDDNEFNIISIIISAIKTGETNWTLLAWRTSSGEENVSDLYQEAMEKNNTSVIGAFFREIRRLILDPSRSSFSAAQTLNGTLTLLNLFCGCTLWATQLWVISLRKYSIFFKYLHQLQKQLWKIFCGMSRGYRQSTV